jgi:hypothetical protein
VQYEYDGTGRRIQKIFAGTSVADEDTYYTEGFQAIETRRSFATATRTDIQPARPPVTARWRRRFT